MNNKILKIVLFIIIIIVSILLLIDAFDTNEEVNMDKLNLSFHYNNPKPIDSNGAKKIEINTNDDHVIDIDKIDRCVDNSYISVHKSNDQYYDLYNIQGSIILDCDSEEKVDENENIAIIKKNNLYGAMDLNGNWIISPTFDSMEIYNEGISLVSQKDSNGIAEYGYIDTTGNIVIPAQYEDATFFLNNRAIVSKGGIYNIIDKEGNTLIENSEYTEMNFLNTYIQAYKNDVCGLLDYNGKAITECTFGGAIATFSKENCILQKVDGSFIMMNINGETIVDGANFLYMGAISLYDIDAITNQIYKNAINMNNKKFSDLKSKSQYDELYMVVTNNQYIGLVDQNGNYIIEPNRYRTIDYISDEFIVVNEGALCGAIDIWNNPVLELNHKSIIPVTSNYVAVKDKYNFYGIIDYNVRQMVESSYTDILGYGDGLITTIYRDKIYPNEKFMPKEGNKYYYIDLNGNIILDCSKASSVQSFINGTAIVEYDREFAIIDTNGNTIIGNLTN